MLSQELIQQIKRIQLKAGRQVTGILSGEYSSAFKGAGMEFDKVREYTPGDDIRNIDWNVTARMQAPFVKVYKEEREMTIMILVDVSSSLFFGSIGQFKNEAAVELAAMIAFLATANNDKVGLIVFSDHIEEFIVPKKGRAHIWKIIKTILSHKSKKSSTDISLALKYFSNVVKRKSTAFLISDFIDDGFEKQLQITSRKHDLICVSVEDQSEVTFPDCGFIDLVDSETGELITVDSSDKDFLDAVSKDFLKQNDFFKKMLQRNRIDHFSINTKEATVTSLIRYMKKRERRLR